jgi:hypothetical protein
MVANLSIGIWQGYRLDKEASRKVTNDAGASSDAARVNKHLIPKAALAPIVTAQNAIRTHFYDNSLPWRDNGDRLITRVLYLKFIEQHEALVTAFKDEVRNFLDNEYPGAIEQAAFRMGAMFKRDDYPPVWQLEPKFYARLGIDAISTADDFRVQIDAEHVDKIKSQMATEAEARLQAAMGDVWKRMADTVSYFQQRMADPKAVFRDSTVTNIGEMLDLIPGLNVLDDPDIELIRKTIADSLGGIEAKEIRKDPALREELSTEATAIMDKMAGFMRAFGGEA